MKRVPQAFLYDSRFDSSVGECAVAAWTLDHPARHNQTLRHRVISGSVTLTLWNSVRVDSQSCTQVGVTHLLLKHRNGSGSFS